jgi:acetyl esterase/lipase
MSIRTFVFASPGGEELSTDAYLPDAAAAAPVVIAIHGGSWRSGTRSTYKHIGGLLAERGYALLAIDYRLVLGQRSRYPAAIDDVRAAIRYVREHAAELNADPTRIVLMGDSAGGHLAALAGLTERPQVKAVVGIAGVYDLAAQWQHDLSIRINEGPITNNFLGAALPENRQLYFDASPVSHATVANCGPSFLLAWGTNDDIVDPSQSEAFMLALKQAGFWARPVVQFTSHFWIGEPLDEPGSHSAYFAARLLRFLDDRVKGI